MCKIEFIMILKYKISCLRIVNNWTKKTWTGNGWWILLSKTNHDPNLWIFVIQNNFFCGIYKTVVICRIWWHRTKWNYWGGKSRYYWIQCLHQLLILIIPQAHHILSIIILLFALIIDTNKVSMKKVRVFL